MQRTFHDVSQGTPEWQALRAAHFTASEAPAMMGTSPYETRGALLRRKATGIAPDVDDATQRRFDAGHAAEAAMRPLAEGLIGDELFPAVITAEVDGLKLLASMDGLTMDGATGWENKLRNADTIAHIERHGEPPMHHVWQLEHQLLVSGAERVLFTCGDEQAGVVAHCWYTSKPERRKAIIEGWRQFAHDLATTDAQASIAASPAPAGRAPELLPALRIEVSGQVVASNLADFKARALAVIRGINRDLHTDQDFADAERTVKWCADVEARLKAAKEAALAQTADIDALFRAIDEIAAEARSTRLELDKLVKSRKEQIKSEIQHDALQRLRAQFETDFASLGAYAPEIPANAAARIAEAMRGKKTVQSLKDAADAARAALATEVAQTVARVSLGLAVARRIEAETDMGYLWPDLRALLLQSASAEQLEAVLRMRIAQHEAAERERQIKEAEAEREAKRVVQAAARAAKPAQTTPAATIRLGDIQAMLHPLSITEAGIASLGIEPVGRDGRAVIYRHDDLPRLRDELLHHIEQRIGAALTT